MQQAVNAKSRYKPVTHHRLQKGNIVMVKEECCKPINYPMAIVKDTKVNNLGEVTEVKLLKGRSREVIRRHVTSLIPILSHKETTSGKEEMVKVDTVEKQDLPKGGRMNTMPRRKAAVASEQKTKIILTDA